MPNFKFSDYGNVAVPANGDIMLWENAGATNSINQTFAQLKASVAPTVGVGGMVFGGVGGALSVDTSNLVWNNTTKQMGIGAAINSVPGPNQFPIADFHIKKSNPSLRVDNSFSTGTARISSRSLISGDAVVAAERFSVANNGYFEWRTALGGVAEWFVGHFAAPGSLQTALQFKSNTQTIGGNPIMVITKSGSVGIGTAANAPIGALQIGGTGGLVVGLGVLGGNKGAGTVNATNIFIRNVQGPMRNTTRATGESTYTTTATDYIISVTITPAPRTITLGTASLTRGNASEWVPVIVKDISGGAGSNNILIDTEGGALIDGAASISITVDNGIAILYSDGTNWHTA